MTKAIYKHSTESEVPEMGLGMASIARLMKPSGARNLFLPTDDSKRPKPSILLLQVGKGLMLLQFGGLLRAPVNFPAGV